jgi:hypothetical protein
MKVIKCNPGDLDNVKNSEEYDFLYFTVRNGKAKYHMLHLPDRSCGIYYALRVTSEGLEGKRALEPLDEINCFVKEK